MILLRIFRFSAMFALVSCIVLSPLSYAAENSPNEGMTEDVVLIPRKVINCDFLGEQ
jgi:hypothetical protein